MKLSTNDPLLPSAEKIYLTQHVYGWSNTVLVWAMLLSLSFGIGATRLVLDNF